MTLTLPRVLLFLLPFSLSAQTSDATLDSLWSEYIRKYKDIAMDEMERSGVPASIKLAQGILESRAGTSELATNANNHFGIKCGKDWRGKSYKKDDDEHNRKGERVHSCFRQYGSVVECFADHSEFIRNPEKQHRYGFLFELDPLDYKAWAKGLQDAGYSSVDYYAEKLIFFIERYQLYELDARANNGRVALKRLAQVNDVHMLQARDGETPQEIAQLYRLPLDKLLEYNDFRYAADEPLSIGAWVYVESKRDSWNGPEIFHRVDTDQRLFEIAQMYGVQLDALRRLNGLQAGEEPDAGERLRLRGKPMAGETLRRHASDEALAPQAVPAAQAPPDSAGVATASTGFIIEMLPEDQLTTPVPAYLPPVSETEKTVPSDPAVLLQDEPDPEPLIVFDTASGQTELYHTVSKGDTLYSIAHRYGLSTVRLRQLNRLKDSTVKIGQSLRVK